MNTGAPGQILACNPDPAAGPPSSQPMTGGSAYCPGGYNGCTYIFGLIDPSNLEEPITGTNLQGGSSEWTLFPAGQNVFVSPGSPPQTTTLSAVFKISSVNQTPDAPPINNLNPYSCATAPPTKIPTPMDISGYLNRPSDIMTEPMGSTLGESKKLRKSLKESLYGTSSDKKLKNLIKKIIKNKN